jgi:hypothetical protein
MARKRKNTHANESRGTAAGGSAPAAVPGESVGQKIAADGVPGVGSPEQPPASPAAAPLTHDAMAVPAEARPDSASTPPEPPVVEPPLPPVAKVGEVVQLPGGGAILPPPPGGYLNTYLHFREGEEKVAPPFRCEVCGNVVDPKLDHCPVDGALIVPFVPPGEP